MKKSHIYILGAIFIIAVFFRFYQLAEIPVGFHVDEAITADNANFILHTARDTNNTFMPLQTEVFNDYNPTGYTYLTILPIKFLGLTEFATRLPGALLGSITAIAIFFLVYLLLENVSVALLSSAFFALSPWNVVISRSSEQTAVSIFFVVLGFSLLLYSLRKKSNWYLMGATILLFVSYFMYFIPRFFVPILFFSFFIQWKYWWEKRHETYTKLFLGSFLFLAGVAASLVLVINGGSNRLNQVSIFGFPETRLVQEEQIREDGIQHAPLLQTRIFHNKVISYSHTFINNYLAYFSPDFLFLTGGLPSWFKVPQMGLVYIIELPFILFGIYSLLRKKKRWSYLLFVWLLIAPITAAITVDDVPNVRRSLFMLVALEAFAAFGIYHFFMWIPKKINKSVLIIFTFLFLYNIGYFWDAYFTHATIHRNWYRGEGFNVMIGKIKQVYDNYDHIIITKSNNGAIYAQLLFYMNYDPLSYLQEGAKKDADYTGFGKFFFIPQECPYKGTNKKIPKGKNVYVRDGKCKAVDDIEDPVKQEYINRKDGTPVFHMIYEK